MTDPSSAANLADLLLHAEPGPADIADLAGALPAGWQPSPRARRAEMLAQRVLGDPVAAAPLRDLVTRAAEATGAEHGQISIISTRQIAVVVERGTHRRPGTQGAATGATAPFEDTVCAVSVRADAPIAIPDAQLDDRVASLPAVVGGVLGAYLGSPIRAADGSVLGVLCVYDRQRHDWTPAAERALDALASQVSDALARLSDEDPS